MTNGKMVIVGVLFLLMILMLIGEWMGNGASSQALGAQGVQTYSAEQVSIMSEELSLLRADNRRLEMELGTLRDPLIQVGRVFGILRAEGGDRKKVIRLFEGAANEVFERSREASAWTLSDEDVPIELPPAVLEQISTWPVSSGCSSEEYTFVSPKGLYQLQKHFSSVEGVNGWICRRFLPFTNPSIEEGYWRMWESLAYPDGIRLAVNTEDPREVEPAETPSEEEEEEEE